MFTRLKTAFLTNAAFLLLVGLPSACSHFPTAASPPQADKRTRTPERWETPPAVPIEPALSKAIAFLKDKKQNLTGGYVLQASRDGDCWWFDFQLLPRSPDFEINVRVFDSGHIDASPLAPTQAESNRKL